MIEFPCKIELADGTIVTGCYHKHLRTLTHGGANDIDIDAYRLEDGRVIVCRTYVRTIVQDEDYQAMYNDGSLMHL